MRCGKCKQEGVTNEHVRDCYGLRPQQTSNATPDIDREKDAANEARAQETARKKAEWEQKRAALKRNRQAETKRKQNSKRKRQERARTLAEDRKAADREAARHSSAQQRAGAESYRQRKASECKACGLVPDINGRCNCS